jgi:hypothetical protein
MKAEFINPEDKQKVLSWLEKYCNGYKNARTRGGILPYVGLEGRYFRRIISELKHEGHCASTSDRGYWFIPLSTNDKDEIDAALQSVLENKSRALDLLTNCDKQIKLWESRKQAITQGQTEMFGVNHG